MKRGRRSPLLRSTSIFCTHHGIKRQRGRQTVLNDHQPAVCQFVGYKNSGKTTLICHLIPLLQQKGFTVAVIKHDAHGFEIDQPATDTWRQREAGATGIAITSPTRTARIEERGSGLAELITSFEAYDYILIEGFKHEDYPKIVLIHEEDDLQLLDTLSNITAIAFWEPIMNKAAMQVGEQNKLFDINNRMEIANYLIRQRYCLQHFNI